MFKGSDADSACFLVAKTTLVIVSFHLGLVGGKFQCSIAFVAQMDHRRDGTRYTQTGGTRTKSLVLTVSERALEGLGWVDLELEVVEG